VSAAPQVPGDSNYEPRLQTAGNQPPSNLKQNDEYDLVLERIYLSGDGSISLTIHNAGKKWIPHDIKPHIFVRIISGEIERILPLFPAERMTPLGGQEQCLDPKSVLEHPGARLEVRSGVTVTRSKEITVEIDSGGKLKESNLANNKATAILSPAGRNVPGIADSASTLEVTRKVSDVLKKTLSRDEETRTSGTNQQASAQPSGGKPDLVIEKAEIIATIPPVFHVVIKNAGSGDFPDSVFIVLFWKTLPDDQWEFAGVGLVKIIESGAAVDVEVPISESMIRAMLDSGKIKPGSAQEARFVLEPQGSAAASEPKENNEATLRFYWDPPLNEMWSTTVGHESPEYPMSIRSAGDGSWLVASAATEGPTHLWLIKGDKTGNVLWQKSYRPPEPDIILEPMAMEMLEDGTAVILSRHSEKNKHSALVLRVDPEGKLLWQKIVATDRDCYLTTLFKDRDGNLWLAGHTNGLGFTEWHALTVVINSDGNPVWGKTYRTYPDGAEEYVSKARSDRAGNVYMIGSRYLRKENAMQEIALVLNKQGLPLKAGTYKLKAPDAIKADFKLKDITDDGNILAFGTMTTQSGVRDFLSIFTVEGKPIWARSFAWLRTSCLKAETGSGILAGTGSPGVGTDMLIMKIDSNGMPAWGKWHGVRSNAASHKTNAVVDLSRAPDGGLLALARADMFAPSKWENNEWVRWPDVLVMKLDRQGEGTLNLWNWDSSSQDKGALHIAFEPQELEFRAGQAECVFKEANLTVRETTAKISSWGKRRYSW